MAACLGAKMRPVKRNLRQVSLFPTRPYKSRTGAVTLYEITGEQTPFLASVYPFDRRIFTDRATRRPLERLIFIPSRPIQASIGDHLRLAGDSRTYRISRVLSYPRHLEIEAERML
jgi:hypothetical protein